MSLTPLESFAAAYLDVSALLTNASEAQWQAGKTPVPREDTTERSSGMTSDPTPTITADGRRLALRAAVVEAELSIESADRILGQARSQLTEALTKWQG